MTDRLAELRRQRSLISEHLAWLDREIGEIEREASRPVIPGPSTPQAALLASPSTKSVDRHPPPIHAKAAHAAGMATEPPTGVADPEIILEKFRAPPDALKRDVRQGCLLYFAGAFVLLGIAVAVLYYTIGSR